MKTYTNGLITQKRTMVVHEKEFKFNAPHLFKVERTGEYLMPQDVDSTGINDLLTVHFQEGPILENGLNGVFNEDLLAMVLCRLEHFQKSEFSCRENAVAITKIEEALMWLRKRTDDREARGVLGSSQK